MASIVFMAATAVVVGIAVALRRTQPTGGFSASLGPGAAAD